MAKMKSKFNIAKNAKVNIIRGDGSVEVVSGCNMIIGADGVVTVDGVAYGGEDRPVVKVEVSGNVQSLKAEAGDVVVNGNAGCVTNYNGDITISKGKVTGGVKSYNGDIYCREVNGDVTSVNGDVNWNSYDCDE